MSNIVNYVFSDSTSFEACQRMAIALSKSTLVPSTYQNNIPNCIIALEISQRTGSSPLMVMQNLNIIYNRPSWSSKYIIASINTCGRFDSLRFDFTGEGDERSCYAHTLDKKGNELKSPVVSIKMAKLEGWYAKNGSKWQTMPELMLMYRAASFFGNLYAPEILMGMSSTEEVYDVEGIKNITPDDEKPKTNKKQTLKDILDVSDVPEVQIVDVEKQPAAPVVDISAVQEVEEEPKDVKYYVGLYDSIQTEAQRQEFMNADHDRLFAIWKAFPELEEAQNRMNARLKQTTGAK